MSDSDTKVCRSCLERKSVEKFREYPALKDGRYSYCLQCERRLRSEWGRSRARKPKTTEKGEEVAARNTEELSKAFEEISSGYRRLERVLQKALGDGKRARREEADEPETDEAPEPEKKKRGRPPKKAARKKAARKKGPTVEDARAAASKLLEDYEDEVLEDLLAEFGDDVEAVSDLAEKDYAKFVERCEEYVEQAREDD